jgi:hypothetical protein
MSPLPSARSGPGQCAVALGHPAMAAPKRQAMTSRVSTILLGQW